MEASYPVDRVTRFVGTNKRSVYMEPSYSASLICSIHCSYNRFGGGVVLYVRQNISFSDRIDLIPDELEMV